MMDELIPDDTILDQEHTGHLETVADLPTDPMPLENPGLKASHHDLQPEQLGELAFPQTEHRIIETPRIGHMLGIMNIVFGEVLIRSLIIGHMNKDHMNAIRLERILLTG